MTSTRRWLLAGITALALLGGCATTQPVDPKDDSTSLVFGYFDAKDAPSDIDWVSIKQYGGGPAYYNVSASKGMFWHIGVEPGAYQVEKFGGAKRFLIFGNTVEYNYGTQGRNATAIRVAKPGVYFMGAHRYVAHDGGFLGSDKFEMQATKSPTEKELLARLIGELEADKDMQVYTRQIALAKKRLAELSR